MRSLAGYFRRMMTILLSAAMILTAVPQNVYAYEIDDDSEILYDVEDEEVITQDDTAVYDDVEEAAISSDDIASGSYGNVTWVIDANGKLTVKGTGEFKEDGEWYGSWEQYKDVIKEAVIELEGTKNLSHLLAGCSNLTTVDLSKLDTSNAQDMSRMFYLCENVETLDVSNFNTSNVTDMSGMFEACRALKTLDLSKFDTSNVIDMSCMFQECENLQALDVSNFSTSNVTDMLAMFQACRALKTLDVSKFDTSNVIDMSCMFLDCNNLQALDVSKFNTSNVTEMSSMFCDCRAVKTLDVSKFDTSNVTSANSMFSGCISLEELDVSNFNTEKMTDMGNMFALHGLSEGNSGSFVYSPIKAINVSGFNTSNVTNMRCMFSGCANVEEIDVSNFDTSNVVNMEGMFSNCSSVTKLDLKSFNTSNVKDMSCMFQECCSLDSLDLSNFDTSNVTDMSAMFDGCYGLTSLDTTKFDTSKVTDMSWMFCRCWNIETLNLSNFDTHNVTNMYCMFCSYYAFTYLNKLKSIKIQSFDTSNVTNMAFMFGGCAELTEIDLSHLDTSNVTDMDSMFENCSSLKSLDMKSFDTSKVENMDSMFSGCNSISELDISNFNMANVTEASEMLSCKKLVSIKAPTSVNIPIKLPTDNWKRCDTDEDIEYLPLNLSTSVLLERKFEKIAQIVIPANIVEMFINDNCRLCFSVLPIDADVSQLSFMSSDENIVKINPDLTSINDNWIDVILTTGANGGTATITASAGDVSATMEVEVIEPVKLDKHEITLVSNPDSKDTITATVNAENYSADMLVWSSSNENVATVVNGVVTAVEGLTETATAEITAETPDHKYKDTCLVTVIPVKKVEAPIANIYSGEVDSGAIVTFTCQTEEAQIYCTLDGTVPSMDTQGNPAGTTRLYIGGLRITKDTVIKAFAVKEGYKDSEIVEYIYTVKESPAPDDPEVRKYVLDVVVVAGGKINNSSLAKTKADGKQYKITIEDKKIATVSSKGLIQGKKAGITTATVTKKDVEYKLNITVIKAGFTAKTYKINTGNDVKPAFVSGTAEISSYKSSKPDVAAVYPTTNGIYVVALKKGTATLTAVCNGKKYTATVKVYDPCISGTDFLLLNKKTSTLSIKNGCGKTIWSSDNSDVVTIKNGKIKGVSTGSATITAVNNGRTMTKVITVYEVPKFEYKTYYTDVDTPLEVTFIYDGKMGNPVYSVSSKKVATIDENGILTPIKKGTVTVTAKIRGKKYTTKVKIKNRTY